MEHPGNETVQKDKITWRHVQKNKMMGLHGYETVQKNKIVSEFFYEIRPAPIRVAVGAPICIYPTWKDKMIEKPLEKIVEEEMTKKHVCKNLEKDKMPGGSFFKSLQSANHGVTQKEIVRVQEDKVTKNIHAALVFV